MKLLYQTLPAVLLFLSSIAAAQKKEPVLLLKEGPVKATPNITDATITNFNEKAAHYRDKRFAILQFESLPTAETRNFLAKQGIILLEYIPENAYTVSITGKLNTGLLRKVGARSILQPTPKQKMHPALAKGLFPDWSKKVKGQVDVWVSFPKSYTGSEVMQFLKEKKIDVVSTQNQGYQILEVRLAPNRLDELASFPFIEYVEPLPGEAKPLNLNSRNGTRANVLNTAVADGGKGLTGEGVVVGIGDEGKVTSHTDVTGSRLVNELEYYSNSFHSTHVTTTVAGAGVINELYKGYAPKATIISQSFSRIVLNAPQYVQDYGMVLSNNSYAAGDFSGSSCYYYGGYSFSSRMIDQQAFDFPYLQHVFAAGNDGQLSCNGYPLGFHTVYGSYQSAKNVITVGATAWDGSYWSTSSKGPVEDGRIKPEIMAQGGFVVSGDLNNRYQSTSGTSMAAPAVTGGLALLYQRYRQLHGGANPKNALIKALLCNGGADKGNAGPDYTFGFGWMHLLRSVEMMEKNQYQAGTLTQGAEQNYTIVVPTGTAQLKVMLYWNDPAASPMSSKALVNDLDLNVTDQSQAKYLPQVLEHSVAGVQNVATTGADHVNNLEQVVINNPTAGSYTINISGAVAQNPSQDYFVVYDIIPVSTTLTNPTGGQSVTPGETVQINWDSYGDPANTFTLKYSTDNGASWTTINSAVSATARQYAWVVPNIPSNQALVRIERNGTVISHTTQPFTIIGVPTLSLAPVQCEGYVGLTWTPVAGATAYEIMMKQDNEMVPVTTTAATSYTLGSLSKDSLYWVSVRALVGDKPGRRAIAISRQPNSGTCEGSISDNDLKLDTLIGPANGRKHTSLALSGTSRVTIRVKNLDDAPVTGFTLKYKRNSNDWVTESVPGVTIPAGATYTHTFAAAEDLSAAGDYKLVAVVDNHTADPVAGNDTLVTIVRHVYNEPINLTTPFLDDLEGAAAAVYTKDAIVLAGIDRYDFTDLSLKGRLAMTIPVPLSGKKTFWLSANGSVSTTAVESITGTYNLSNYNANIHDIRLNFKARHSILPAAQNNLWVRGSDDQPWIALLNLNAYPATITEYSNIELMDSLVKYGQNVSPSFQLKWDHTPGNGVLFLDDIMLYEVFDDLQLLEIDTSLNQNCGTAPLQITLRNSSNKALTNVPVKFRINDGTWTTEFIPSIAPNTTMPYTFSTPLGFSTPGSYTLTALVDFLTDNIRMNDTLHTTVNNASIVRTFPYLQNFENGENGWFSSGENSSWTYGTPSSSLINKAASGTKAWQTRLSPDPASAETSDLFSPCFDISGMANPTLSFSMAMDLYGFIDPIYDMVTVYYSTDNHDWYPLVDTASTGTNWYSTEWYAWDSKKPQWHVVTMGLPKNAGTIRFLIQRYKHPDATTAGIAIDDIHIYDSANDIYEAASPSVTVTKAVSGNNWVDFESGGQLVASIHPNGQNLGNTAVQAFIHSGAVRNDRWQYYHNRNITIKPEITTLTDSVTVRMYFIDSEAEALINAAGCAGCTKPASAYELGVSKYSDPVSDKENGTIQDNNEGIWSFIPSAKVTIVPFQKGYYAEFKVKDFSEFWLSNGGLDGITPLPVKLTNFSAQRTTGDNVLLKWNTAQEINVSRFEIELAKTETDLQAGRFVKIGEVNASGNSTALQSYAYTDRESEKYATRYYRLKMIDKDGSFTYSPVRAVLFNKVGRWQVYPNPSTGVFSLVYQIPATEHMDATVFDINGQVIKQDHQQGTGNVQRLAIDLTAPTFASGIYMLQVEVNGRKEFFKLYKL